VDGHGICWFTLANWIRLRSEGEVGSYCRTHGSAFFSNSDTQLLVNLGCSRADSGCWGKLIGQMLWWNNASVGQMSLVDASLRGMRSDGWDVWGWRPAAKNAKFVDVHKCTLRVEGPQALGGKVP